MQASSTVLMVEPVAFGYNAQTAENNYFQVNSQEENTQDKALKEFQDFVQKLRDHGVEVVVVKDTLEPHTPDSIYPNNWISFHSDGTVILYPMFAPNRRDEKRMDVLDLLKSKGYEVGEIVDLSYLEAENKFLEGTGSMIFDHENRLAYGSVSLRLDPDAFQDFCVKFDYTPVMFHSYQSVGSERMLIYHTNVMMCIADKYAIICLDAIDQELEREKVQEMIKSSGKEVIEISEEQMASFAGNMLQVKNKDEEKFLVMSTAAYNSLNDVQLEKIRSYNEIIHSDLKTIETNGGGSARCMLAEVFLPKDK